MPYSQLLTFQADGATLLQLVAPCGTRRLSPATILSTVGFHQRLDLGLHLRAARDCHLPAAGVFLVARGFATGTGRSHFPEGRFWTASGTSRGQIRGHVDCRTLARLSFLIASNNANSLFSQQLRHNALGRAGAALPFTSHTGGTPWNRKTPGLWIRRMTTSQSTSDRYSGETRSTLRIWQGENGTVDHEARKSAGKDGPGMLDQRRFCSFPFLVVKKHKGLSISSPSAHP